MTGYRSQEEVDEQVNLAAVGMDSGSRWPGMSYEQGVHAALSWIMGWSEDKPMEDDRP